MSQPTDTPETTDIKDPLADAIAIVAADWDEREKKCLAEVQAAFQKYRCALLPVIHGQSAPPGFVQFQIAAQERTR